MFFLLILDSKDAFDLSLLETNLTECYLRSSGSSLPRSLSAKAPGSWSPLCPPSLDTNKCPSSEQWIQSFAFIGDTNPVFSVLDSASHRSLERERSERKADWFEMYSSLVTTLVRIMVQSKYPPDQTSDVLMSSCYYKERSSDIFNLEFSPQIKIWKSYWHSI